MYAFLGWFGLAVGVFVLAVILWEVLNLVSSMRANPEVPFARHLLGLFSRWTWFDTALSVLFVLGMMFLLADLLAVARERELYPYYRFGYLLSSFIYSLLGMLFLWGRLFVIMKYGNVVPNASATAAKTTAAPADQTTDTENSVTP